MNTAILVGNITKDLEVRRTQSDKQVLSFTLAINEGKDKTEFVNCVAWEKSAEVIGQYCRKGSQLAIQGRIQTRKQETDQGNRYYTEVVVDRFTLPPKGSPSSTGLEQSTSNGQVAGSNPAGNATDELIDEIPFASRHWFE